jgi:hypothetical protein
MSSKMILCPIQAAQQSRPATSLGIEDKFGVNASRAQSQDEMRPSTSWINFPGQHALGQFFWLDVFHLLGVHKMERSYKG